MNPLITVVTVTRRRVPLLARALASVIAQNIDPAPRHLVLVDDCPDTVAFLSAQAEPALTWSVMARDAGEHDGPERLARLRNAAIARVTTPWTALLDDDNEYAPDHLWSLLACAVASGARAVYSWRTLHYADGSPYLAPSFPWPHAGDDPAAVYRAFVQRGVYKPGSHVARDRADPLDHPNPIRTVDANEWLIDTALLQGLGFQERHTEADIAQQKFEDGRLLLDLLRRGELLACSGRATVRYYLGGLSNTVAKPVIATP